MQRFRVFHETVYEFSREVTLGPHKLLMRPREGHDIRIESSSLKISPDATVKWHRDELDNSVAMANFSQTDNQLKIVSEVTVQHYDEWPLDFLVDDYAVSYPFAYEHAEHLALSPYLHIRAEDDTALFKAWLSRFNERGTVETYAVLSQISQAINTENQYTVREEPGVQSPDQTLSLKSGSCRDFAWLFMVTARHLGFATRFVSGYLHAPGTELDYGATHAWAEVYLPGAGWKGFDPTSRQVTGSQHIATAVSIMPESIPPISGRFTGPVDERPVLFVKVKVNLLESSQGL